MRCTICGLSIDSIEEAIEQKWILTFFEGDELHGPACRDCSRSLLEICKDGEFAVKEIFSGKIVYLEECLGGMDHEPLSMGSIFN